MECLEDRVLQNELSVGLLGVAFGDATAIWELQVQGRPKPTNERVKTKMARTIRDGFGRRQRRSVIVC